MLIKRESRMGANDLITTYRPCKTDEVFGNASNMNIIKKGLDTLGLSHSLLFTGDSGCGKTTTARIVALGLNCESLKVPTSKPCLECNSCRSIINHNNIDVLEINAGQDGGKDDTESTVRNTASAPFMSRYKVIIFDEAHKITPAGQALLLKVIEDGYSHVYFIFCTNKPEKLDSAFVNRCTRLHFGPLSRDLILKILKNVAEYEGMNYNKEIFEHIAEESRGVPRVALNCLKQVNDEGSWTFEAAREIIRIAVSGDDPAVIELCRAMIKGSFKESVTIYDGIKEKIEAESVRIALVGYFVACLKRSRTHQEAVKFSSILDVIFTPIFDRGKLGDYKIYQYMYKVTSIISGKGDF
jgi:DNA polymerase-3 subunit gamma/tau